MREVTPATPRTAHGPALQAPTTDQDPDGDETWVARLAEAAPADRHALILTCVVEAAAEVMGADSPDTVPLGTPLLDLGFTSLMAVDLRNKVTQATGVDLPPTVVYDHPTFEAIASHAHALMSTD